MKFYGFKKTTLIDYPGRVASIIFTKGCNLSCPFCHNRELVVNDIELLPIEWEEIYNHLQKRRTVISGVCISGGEPLLYADELVDIIKQIHRLGLKVKIDTNGILFEKLKSLDVDYIAMDIKTSLDKYYLLSEKTIPDIANSLMQSIDYIISSGIEHKFRTTVVPDLVTLEDIEKITDLLIGTQKYVLAQYRPYNTLNPDWENIIPYNRGVLSEMKRVVEEKGIKCELRFDY